MAKSIVADSPPRRVAAIDVGTNSVRLIIAETTGDVSYRVLDDEKEVTRLGRGLGRTGRLDPGAMEHTAATIANMVAIARGYHATSIRAVATAATREASNAREFLELIKARAGIDVEIISGEREAELAFASASRAFDLAAQPSMVIDIGGGSMELIFVAPQFGPNASGVIDQVFSLPLGAVRLTEQFGGPEKAGGAKYHRVREHVLSTLQKEIGDPPLRLALVVGTGGTVTTLGTIARVRERAGQRADSGLGSVQGVEVSRAEIKHIIQQLRGLKVKDRARIAGLPADRADIFVAGLTAVDCALKFLGANRIRVHEGGIRDGLLLDMLGLPESLASDAADPIRSAERFAIACGYEAAHSNHVTALALRLFDLLNAQHINARRLEWQDEHRLLLQVASLLHDTGYLIGYAQHHKHSQHLIMHAGLRGLTSRQVQMVACIARYHRAAEPKASQRGFCELSREDQRSVEALSGILRVADGLDRTHTQGVNLGRLEKVGNSISLETRSEREPSVDLWGAKRKARLFERTFEVKLDLIWRSDQGETADRPRTKSGTPEHPPVLKRRLHRGGIEGVAKIREK